MPPRIPKRSCLVVVEGEGEQALCLYIKEHLRHCGTRIEIKNACGGSPKSMFEYADKLLQNVAHDRLVVVMDKDVSLKPVDNRAWTRIELHNEKGSKRLIFARPCLEAEALRLLGRRPPSDTKGCCQALEKLGYSKQDLAERKTWANLVAADDLASLRAKSAWLNELIEALAGEY